MALIEIDGLPIKNGGSFHSYVTVYQAGYISRQNIDSPRNGLGTHKSPQVERPSTSPTVWNSSILEILEKSNLVGGWPTPLKNMKVSWGYFAAKIIKLLFSYFADFASERFQRWTKYGDRPKPCTFWFWWSLRQVDGQWMFIPCSYWNWC